MINDRGFYYVYYEYCLDAYYSYFSSWIFHHLVNRVNSLCFAMRGVYPSDKDRIGKQKEWLCLFFLYSLEGCTQFYINEISARCHRNIHDYAKIKCFGFFPWWESLIALLRSKLAKNKTRKKKRKIVVSDLLHNWWPAAQGRAATHSYALKIVRNESGGGMPSSWRRSWQNRAHAEFIPSTNRRALACDKDVARWWWRQRSAAAHARIFRTACATPATCKGPSFTPTLVPIGSELAHFVWFKTRENQPPRLTSSNTINNKLLQ